MANTLQEADDPERPEHGTSRKQDPGEEQTLAALQRRDLAASLIEEISKSATAMKSRKVKLAIVLHPRAPRHVALPLLRHLFTFDLMQATLGPVVPGDVKKAAEDTLLGRLETIALGERMSLARRASGRVAGELLLDAERQVIEAALENPQLTEAAVVKALLHRDAPEALVRAVCLHAKWPLRREVRVALLRNEHTPLARAVDYARSLPAGLVREILSASRLPAEVKEQVREEVGE